MQFNFRIMLVSIVIANTLFGHMASKNALALNQTVQTKSSYLTSKSQQGIIDRFIRYLFPKNRKYTASGGRRRAPVTFGDSCPVKKIPLIALIPGENDASYTVITSQSNPTLWFYAPQANSENFKKEFTLKDEQDNKIESIEYIDSSIPGVIGVRVKENIEQGKYYFWSFNIICNPQKRHKDVRVRGEILKLEGSYSSIASSEERAILYAKDGFWSESLTTLITEVYPNDSQRGLLLINQLLKSVDLGPL
jgi:Domain of Unknown Function (DUF928)